MLVITYIYLFSFDHREAGQRRDYSVEVEILKCTLNQSIFVALLTIFSMQIILRSFFDPNSHPTLFAYTQNGDQFV